MPDITFRFIGDDQVTPEINKIKGEMASLQSQAKTLGGGAHRAGEGGFWSEQLKELTAGIGYQIGLWNIGFMVAERATEALGSALAVLIPDLQSYNQWMNTVGGSNVEAASSFNDLKGVAIDTWSSIGETQKRAQSFMEAGFSPEAAVQATGMIQAQIRDTGEDLGDAYQKAQNYGAGIADALKVGVAHERERPEIKEQAISDLRFQNTLKYEEFRRHLQEETTEREYQDWQRVDQQERDDRQRAVQLDMEDRHRVVEQEVEDTQHAIERETELRHIAAGQELQDKQRIGSQGQSDRHRQEEWADEDEDRREEHFQFNERLYKEPYKQQVEDLRRQEREDRHFENRRKRQLEDVELSRRHERESRTQQRAFQNESIAQNETLYQVRRDTTRDLADESRDVNRRQFVENRSAQRADSWNQRQIARDNQDYADQVKGQMLGRDMRRQDTLADQQQKDLEEFAKQPKPSQMFMGLGIGFGGEAVPLGAPLMNVPTPKPVLPTVPSRQPLQEMFKDVLTPKAGSTLLPGDPGYSKTLKTEDETVADKLDALLKVFQ